MQTKMLSTLDPAAAYSLEKELEKSWLLEKKYPPSSSSHSKTRCLFSSFMKTSKRPTSIPEETNSCYGLEASFLPFPSIHSIDPNKYLNLEEKNSKDVCRSSDTKTFMQSSNAADRNKLINMDRLVFLESTISSMPAMLTAISNEIRTEVQDIHVFEATYEAKQATSLEKLPVLDYLGDRIRIQIDQGIESATLHLHPPLSGTIQILIQHKNGILEIYLNASDKAVLDEIQNMKNLLQHDLISRGAYSEVHVLISGEHRKRHHQHEWIHPDMLPTQALCVELSEAEQMIL